MNVNLWFARDEQNEIVSVYNSNKENTYHCPICSSEVIPKALESKRMTPHFAHIDRSKCDSESMVHWWFKNKFIDKGDRFSIVTDKEISYVCKDYDVEVTFNLESGIYRPDLVVYTECGEIVVFEMANTNKKKVKDYIDKWIELDKVIIEVDIKALTNSFSSERKFNALYYKGKCFNFNKRDGGYYNTIGKLKEEMKQNGKYDIELVRKLDWFWDELINSRDKEDKQLLYESLLYLIHKNVYNDILYKTIAKHKKLNIFDGLMNYIKTYKIPKLINELESNYPTYTIKISAVNYSEVNKCIELSYSFFIKSIGSMRGESLSLYNISLEHEDIVHKLDTMVSKMEDDKLKDWFLEKSKSQMLEEFSNVANMFKIPNCMKINICSIRDDGDSFRCMIEIELGDKHIDYLVFTSDKLGDKLVEIARVELLYYLNKIKENIYMLEDIQKIYQLKDYTFRLSINLKGLKDIEIKLRNKYSVKNGAIYINDGKQVNDNIYQLILLELCDYLHSAYKDKECVECDNKLNLSKNEIKFFVEKGFKIPKRCKPCRKNRKKNKLEG